MRCGLAGAPSPTKRPAGMCPCMRANIAAILHAAPRAPPVEPGLTDKLAGHMVRMPMGRLGHFPRKSSAGLIQ